MMVQIVLWCAYMLAGTQLIGMSATLNNIADLQAFLHAEVYISNFRPVCC